MKKVGILGGGQLGRMLLQAAANYPVITYVLENDEECPSAHLCNQFIKGDITSYNDVYEFGKNLDALTIEIESVNLEALYQLEKEGKKIYPNPSALAIIKNKKKQKEFYAALNVPTAPFIIVSGKEDLKRNIDFFPAAQKLALGGYDGKGVQILRSEMDIPNGFNEESVLEKEIAIKKEIAIIIGVNEKGATAMYNPVEMIFNTSLNLLDFQLSPARLEEKILWKAEAIALMVVKNLKSAGIFAVELFLDVNDKIWVNETAPRVHNSGHHTIEGNYSSQFDMLWRIILDYPLGNTRQIMNSALVNLVGEQDISGIPVYEGLEKLLEIENVFVHIYNKRITKPGRKMGHITILSNERQELIHVANKIKQNFKISVNGAHD